MATGEEPFAVFVETPIAPQLLINRCAQNGVSILPALAIANEQAVARSVDVIDRQAHALTHPQTAGVDEQQRNAITQQRHPRNDPRHLIRGQNGRKGLTVAGFDLIEAGELAF